MKESERDSVKREYVKEMKRNRVYNQMQKGASKSAVASFKRKPYQNMLNKAAGAEVADE